MPRRVTSQGAAQLLRLTSPLRKVNPLKCVNSKWLILATDNCKEKEDHWGTHGNSLNRLATLISASIPGLRSTNQFGRVGGENRSKPAPRLEPKWRTSGYVILVSRSGAGSPMFPPQRAMGPNWFVHASLHTPIHTLHCTFPNLPP